VIPALDTTAWVFGIAAVFCLVDVFAAPNALRKIGRSLEFIIVSFIAYYYADAYLSGQPIPAMSLRWGIVALAILMISDVVSRWTIRGKLK
jgi:hypothetical protein